MSELVTLGEVLRVKHGYAFPGDGFGEDPGTPQVLTPGNFSVGGGFRSAKPKSFAGLYPSEYLLQPGSLIVTMTDLSKEGDTLGLPAVVPADGSYLHNQRIGLVDIVDPERVEKSFLHYYLRTASYRSFILSTASGSTVRHTSPGRIESFEADLPALPQQWAIAEVLGALDDKITANTKLAGSIEEVLEAEAKLKWFQSNADPVAVTTIVEFNPTNPQPTEIEPAYIDMKKLPQSGSGIATAEHRVAKGGTRFMNGDTLMARITPCLENRKTGFVDALASNQVGVGSTEFIALRAREPYAKPMSYFLAVDEDFRDFAMRHMVGTSGRQRVSATDLAAYEVPQPDASWIRDFGARATKQFEYVKSLRDENRTLAEIRDTLLPQLMSGKLRVRDAEQTVSEVV